MAGKARNLSTQHEKLFRLAFETNPDPIAISRVADGTYVDGNNGLFRVLGYKKEEVLGKTASELGIWVDPKDRERFVEALQGTGACDDLLAGFRRKDGEVVWGLLSARTFELDGQLLTLSITRDITKRIRVEREQRALAASTTAVLQNENIELALEALLTEARNVTAATASFVTTSSEDAMPFKNSEGDEISMDPLVSSRLLTLQTKARKDGKPIFENNLPKRGDGVFNVIFVPLRIEHDLGGIMALANKHGGFDEHDLELSEAFGQICTLALERHHLQSTMAQSDRLASMGMLAAGVAHEINNPLSFILYHLETLEQDLSRLAANMGKMIHQAETKKDTKEQGSLFDLGVSLELIEKLAGRSHDAFVGAQRIMEITRSLGTFSRVEYRETSPVDMIKAIEHAVTMAFNEIKYKARISKEYKPLPTVMASEGHLAQVVLNLLVNAAHAIEEGDVENNEIKLKTWTDGKSSFFEISDTGKGISPEGLQKIFEPFYTTKPIGVGSGLGLSICRNIVKGYGGDISVSSKLGKGSSFVVRLPAWKETGMFSKSKTSTETEEETGSGRILVVDDEEQVRSIMNKILSRKHKVVAVSSGAEALELLQIDRDFDLILCDLMMPNVSGIDLHQWLIKDHPNLASRLIFATGGAFTPKARDYLAKVNVQRVDKPFSAKKLLMVVEEQMMKTQS